MLGDIIDDFAGRRTLQFFMSLIAVVVILYVLGVVLSDLHGITFLETATEGFIEDPMVLLDIAAVFAFFAILIIAVRFVLKNVD